MNIQELISQIDRQVFAETGKHLSDLQVAILRGSLQSEKYEAIASAAFCTEGHVKDVAADLWKQLSQMWQESITKKTLKTVLSQKFPVTNSETLSSGREASQSPLLPLIQDWGDAPDVSQFQGRESELKILQTWIENDHCRFVLLLGMGGIGKSSLAAKLTQIMLPRFEGILWRSLRNAPLLSELLRDLVQILNPAPASPHAMDQQQLFDLLRTHRWFLVLDNVESILEGGDRLGHFRSGYEDYGQLFCRLAETAHRSCCLLTSRELPPGLTAIIGETLPARSLCVSGLSVEPGRAVVTMKATLTGSDQQWQQLVNRYGGNPLALKIVTSAVQGLFSSDLGQFLALSSKETLILNDIQVLLEEQIHRLSDRGREILTELALQREATSLQQLRTYLLHPDPLVSLLQELTTLQQRALIETKDDCYNLQPVVLEFMTTSIIEQAHQELQMNLWEPKHQCQWPELHSLFRRHSLVQTQAQDYIRNTQIRMLLHPLIERWVGQGKTEIALRDQILNLLGHIRGQPATQVGYAGGNLINLLRELPGEFEGLDLSHCVLWNANFQALPLHRVNLAQSDLKGARFSDALGNVLSIAISPDGQDIAAGDMTGQVHIWNLQTGQKRLTIPAHQNWVRAVSFSPNGQILASAGFDNLIHLWEREQGTPFHTLKGHTHCVNAIAFSPDNKMLISGSADHSLRLWSVATGVCVQCYLGHQDWVNAVAWWPDGSQFLSGGADGLIKHWAVDTTQCLQTFTGHERGIFALMLHPQGQLFISGSADHTLGIWSIDSDRPLNQLKGHQGWVNSVSLSPDGTWIASGSSDNTIKLWHFKTGECRQTLRGHENAVWAVTYHPQEQQLISGSFDQTLKIWDTQTGHCLQTFCGYSNAIWSLAFREDAQVLICGSADCQVRLWSLKDQTCNILDGKHQAQVSTVLYTADQKGIISGSFDQTVQIWDLHQNQRVRQLQGHTNGICTVAMNVSGTQLASAGFDQTILLWDVATGRCLKQFFGHTSTIWSIAFSPDGTMLASAGVDAQIRLWNLNTGELLTIFRGHDSAIWSLAFSPDGQWIVSGGVDRLVRLWDVATGHCLNILTGHQDWIFAIAISLNGQWIASAGADQSIRLWDVQTLTNHQILMGHPNKIYCLAFSSKGDCLASGSQDGSIRLWDVNSGNCLQTLHTKRLYEGLNITRATGLTSAQLLTLKYHGSQ